MRELSLPIYIPFRHVINASPLQSLYEDNSKSKYAIKTATPRVTVYLLEILGADMLVAVALPLPQEHHSAWNGLLVAVSRLHRQKWDAIHGNPVILQAAKQTPQSSGGSSIKCGQQEYHCLGGSASNCSKSVDTLGGQNLRERELCESWGGSSI